MATWLTPRACLAYVSLEKLSKLTNEAREKTPIGTGNAVLKAFATPYFGGTAPTIYADGVAVTVGPLLTVTATGTNDRWVATFTTEPAVGVKLEALSTDGVNADVLDQKLRAAQAELRGYINASARFSAPADEDTVGEPVLKWSWDIAAYLLASDLRRAGLLETYPGIADRYADLTGGGPGVQGRPAGFQPILRDVAKGKFDLTGVTGITTKTSSIALTDPFITSAYGNEGDLVFGPPE